MKNRKIAALIAIAVTALLAACSARTREKVSSEEMAVPEVSSQDLLVNSLEYLLEDEEETVQDEEAADGDEANANDNNNADDNADDNANAAEAVIYYGKAGTLTLDKETMGVTAVTPEELLDKLAGHNIVSLDTKILSFEEADKDGASVLYLDLSKAAEEYLRTMSKEAECIIISAIADTFLDNFGADGIYITVEGEPLTTSNSQYEQMITECTPEELLAAMTGSDS